MKRFALVLVLVLLLGGCAGDDSMDRAVAMRQRLLSANGCTFDVTVTADYGDRLHTFVLRCRADGSGEVTFEVLAPDTISGITGTISGEGGALTFDDQVLAFSPLADGQLAPVTAPWLLVHTLRSGYLAACGAEEDGLRLTVDDSYADDALQLDIWLDADDIPSGADVIWQGRRILSMRVESFTYL